MNSTGSPTIGVVSTWNTRCGIAAYTRSLMSGIDPARLRVFANKTTELTRPDESFVHRCWSDGWNDPLDKLFQAVQAARVDAILLQFNFGLFRPEALARLLDRLHAEGISLFVTLHATANVVQPLITVRLSDIGAALAKADRLLVHSDHDVTRLKDIGLRDNVTLFPMGAPRPPTANRGGLRRTLGLEGKTVIASFGYLLPNKGMPELIEAFARMRGAREGLHLLMLHSLYPARTSALQRDACVEQIRRLTIAESVTFTTDFLPEAAVLACLAAADLVVFPYQSTGESASAAVKMGLGSGTPVAVTPLPIFADVAAVTHQLPGTTPEEIAAGLTGLLSDPARLAALTERQHNWAAAHDWAVLSDRLDGLIRAAVSANRRDPPCE